MHFKKILATIGKAATLLLSGHVAGGQAQPSTAGASSALDSVIEQRMKEAGIVGLGAAIIVNKKVAWIKGYGVADKQHAIPFTM